MRFLYLSIFTLFISISGLQAQNAINVESILFEYDKANLTDNSKFQLDEILKINNIDSIQLTGHTDSDGNDTYNLTLSKKRVFAVQNYLVQRDFPNDKIIVDYHGENIPLTDNDSEDGKQQNRRVEITIYFQPEPIVVEKVIKEEPKIIEIPAVDTVEAVVEVVKVIEDTTINIGGLNVTLTKDDFFAYGETPVFEPILTIEDAMRHGLNTMTTSGNLLVSDGMIKVNPLPNGNCFTKPIKVYFPANLANVVGGKRKHYILKNGAWKVGGKKRSIDIVQIDNVDYYEMTIACYSSGYGNYHNCDGIIGDSKHKLKLPVGYRLKQVTFQYNQLPLGIYNYASSGEKRRFFSKKVVEKRKHKFSLPCRTFSKPTNVIVKAYHKKTGKEIEENISFKNLNHSVSRSRCKDCPKNLRRTIKAWKTITHKRFKVKRKLLTA